MTSNWINMKITPYIARLDRNLYTLLSNKLFPLGFYQIIPCHSRICDTKRALCTHLGLFHIPRRWKREDLNKWLPLHESWCPLNCVNPWGYHREVEKVSKQGPTTAIWNSNKHMLRERRGSHPFFFTIRQRMCIKSHKLKMGKKWREKNYKVRIYKNNRYSINEIVQKQAAFMFNEIKV